jgi:uncharacterized protein GlcG (DUF336 family)
MHLRTCSIGLIAATLVALAACSRRGSPAETQAGGAADLSRGAAPGSAPASCRNLPDTAAIKDLLNRAPSSEGEAGGLFSGHAEWAAVVDRQGVLCAVAASLGDPSAVWLGSLHIAKAKAYTANAFSSDTTPLSTARLYTFTQPGHSLWGIAAGSPFNADCLDTPDHAGNGVGKVCGGAIAFGGGVPLYRDNTRVGGLGVSGDTACADHEIAKRMRHLASLDPAKGEFADDITYISADGPSIYSHPLCANTWRNGKKIGEESTAHAY